MTTMQKVVAFAAAAALLALVPFAFGSPLGEPPAVAATQRTAATAAGAPAALPSPVEDAAGEPAASRSLAAAEEPDRRVVVTGRVVDDETGAAIADAEVRLLDGLRQQTDDVATATVADGSFELREARSARLQQLVQARILVRAPDHATLRLQLPRDGAASAAASKRAIDVGELRAVHGTRYSGRVVDRAGVGVAGAELRLPLEVIGWSGVGPEQMLRHTAPLGRTDVSGAFVLDEALAPAAPWPTFLFAIAANGIGWALIEPTAGRRTVDDVTIQLRPSGALEVTVLDAAGKPCEGVQVHALPAFSPIGIVRDGFAEDVSADDDLRARFVGATDARGALRFERLPIGDATPGYFPGMDTTGRRYWIRVEAKGCARQPTQSVEVVPDEVRQIVVRLLDSRRTALTVRVRDDLGAPVAGARIRAYGDEPAQATTDAEGAAVLEVTATASLSVSAEAPAHRRTHRSVPLHGSPTEQLELVLTRTQRLTGRVVDQFGQPLADLHLAVGTEPLGETDADGNFAIDDFPAGPQRLLIVWPSGAEQTRWTGEQSPEIVDASNGPVTIVMQRRPGNSLVRIAVVDAATDEALELVEARLGLFSEQTGHYLLVQGTQQERGLVTSTDTPAGRWRLDVRTATGHRGSLPFEVAVDQPPQDLRLQLQRPGTVLGELRFLDVAAPAEITLQVDHATIDPKAFTQFRYPGTWRPDPASQRVTADPWGGTGALRVHPAQNLTFRLDSADPTDDLVFTVHGDGIEGRGAVRVQPGQTAQVVVEVHG